MRAADLRGCVHNTNLIDSPQFLRGSENFRLAIGFMDGKQMNGDGAWLPISDSPRFAEAPSHLCISLTIADKDAYTGTTGPMDVNFTLHHREPKLSVHRHMRRTFCWGTSGAEYDATTGRLLYRWSHAILDFALLATIRGDPTGFMRDDTLSISVDIAPPQAPEMRLSPPRTPSRKRPPTRSSASSEEVAALASMPPKKAMLVDRE